MTSDERIGRIIDGRYELQERIGEGAMGAVYRAHQQVVDREVAVKLLHGDVAADSDYRTRFEREAKALGRLDHPGCVRVHDFGWWEELEAPFLVAEFVHGDPMHKRLGGLSVQRAVQYGLAIAEAMRHAHGQGIIHRDLKPENVIVRSAEDADTLELKVVDFGLARMPADEEVRLTQAGDAYGTPAYMSPEQCQADEDVGPPADVYALGCMLWEMLHDRLPFQANKASGMMIKHVTSPVPAVERDVPDALADLVGRMMAKSPDARPTMTDVVEVLQGLECREEEAPAENGVEKAPGAFSDDLDPRGDLATADTKRLSPTRGAPDRDAEPTELDPALTRSTPALPLAAGAVLVVAIAAGVWYFVHDEPPPSDQELPAALDDGAAEPPSSSVVARQADDERDAPATETAVPTPEEGDPSGDDEPPANEPSGDDEEPTNKPQPTDRPAETAKANAPREQRKKPVEDETPEPDRERNDDHERDSVDLRY